MSNTGKRSKKVVPNKTSKLNKKTAITIIIIVSLLAIITIVLASTNLTNSSKVSGTADASVYNLGENGIEEGYSALYVENLYYNGTNSSLNKLEEALSNGKTMYSDQATTFTNLPHEYDNSEYLLLPSTDNEIVKNDIITFTAKRNITIIIMRDEATDKPTWLDSTYTQTEKNFVGGNGTTYTIYTKNVTKGTVVIIGSTSDTIDGGIKGAANIIAVKETSLIEGKKFFYDDFSNSDQNSIINGYNGVINTDTILEIDSTTFASDSNHKDVLHFKDDNVESGNDNLAFIEKEIAKVETNLSFKFDMYVPDNSYNNEYLRIYLNKDKMQGPSIKTNVAIQTYINKVNASKTLNAKATVGNVTTFYLTNTTDSYAIGKWHTIEYILNAGTKKFTLNIDGNPTGITCDYYSSSDLIKYFVIGTGQARNSEFYIDNIEIQPNNENMVANILIDGNDIDGFLPTIHEYNYDKTPISRYSDVQLTTTEYYDSHKVEYVPETQTEKAKLLITVYDIYGHEIVYTIMAKQGVIELDGFTVVNSNGSTLNAIQTTYQGKKAIKLSDSIIGDGDLGLIYMYKKFEDQTGEFEFTYDVNIPDDKTIINTWNRIQLSSGIPSNITDATNVGIETYLSKLQLNDTEAYLLSRQANKTNVTYTNAPVQLDNWHNFKYVVNVKSKTYNVYLDDLKIASDISFRDTFKENTLNTMLFATGASPTNEIYIANAKVTKIYGEPIDGIKIEGEEIKDFEKDKYDYSYYCSQEMTTLFPNVEIVENENLKSVSYSRNFETQTITITATNLDNKEYVYRVNIKTLLDRQITTEELQALIDKCYTDYPNSVQNDYVEKGWDNLRSCLTEGQTLIDGGNAKTLELAMSYYKIEQALTKMIKYLNYDYNSGIIEIVRYSEDLDKLFSIDNVLENGIDIYKDSNANEKFYSVPFKMWNAEYIKMSKTFKTDVGAIQFKALVDIDVFIGYDRDAGTLVTEGYTETGDIITSIDETVYKVYKRHYNANDMVVLDFDTCIGNSITGKNSIVAVMDSNQSNNDIFFDTGSENLTTERLNKLWYVDAPAGNAIEMVEHEGENVLRFDSTVNTSMAYMYKRFAKLSDKFEFKFTILNPGKLTAGTDNRWTRTWLTSGTPVNPNTASNNSDKKNILTESYIDNNAVYKNDQVLTAGKWYSNTKLTFNEWNTIIYNYDMTNKKATVEKEGTAKKNDISAAIINNLTYIDNVIFGTRKAGFTWMNFKDISIKPITRDIITDIKVDNNTIGNGMYYPLTKDYLYKYDRTDLTDPTNTVTVDEGTAYGDTSVVIQKTSSTNYAKINLVDSSEDGYTFENRVYLELNVDKSVLTQYVKEAQNLDEYLYTKDSWDELKIAIEDSIAMLKDLKATQTSIDTQAAVLRDKIDSLVLKTDEGISISARVYYGKDFDFSELENQIDMTNDSSITIATTISKTLNRSYSNEGKTHTRKILTSVALPANTKITIMDDTTDDIKYYYYIVTNADFAANKKEFMLNDFTSMGTTDKKFSKPINYNSATREIKEKLTFIIDYEDVEESKKLHTDTYKVSYEIDVPTGEAIKLDPTSIKNTTYNLYDIEKKNTLKTDKDSTFAFQGEDISFNLSNLYENISEESVIVRDTTLKNKKMGIVVTLLKDGQQIAFPTGIIATIIDEEDKTVNDSATNSEGKLFVLYKDDVETVINGKTLTIKQAFENLIQSGTYQIKLDLFQSYDGLNYGKVMSSKTINLEIGDNIGYGLKADIQNGTNPIIHQGETTVLPIEITRSVEDKTIDINQTELTTVLKKKNDLGEYETIDLANYTSEPELSIINSSKKEYGITLAENQKIINLKILGTLGVGTYRLEFNIYNSVDYTKSLADDVENFIIK